MKSIKFFKVTAIVMTIMMLFSIVSAFADAPTQGLTDTIITISGTGTAGDQVTITIYYPGYNAATVDAALANSEPIDDMIAGSVQTEVGTNGAFAVNIPLAADAVSAKNYTIVVSTPTAPNTVYTNFIFGNPADKAAAIADLNTAAGLASNSDAIALVKTTLAENYELLGVNAVLYVGATDKDFLAGLVLADFKTLTLPVDEANIITSIQTTVKRVNVAALLGSYDAGSITSIPAYASYFDQDYASYSDVYADFNSVKLSDAGKAAVLANISGKGYNTIAKLQKAFMDQVILQGINNPGNPPASNVIHFLKDYLTITNLDLTKFNKLSSTQKSEVAIEVMNAKASDFPGVQKALNAAVSGVPGTGNNGGGNSGGDSTTTTYVTPTPTPTVTPKPVVFMDMAGYEWAAPAVDTLVEKKIVSGYGDTFKPGNNINRQEFVKLVVSAFYTVNTSATSSFSDVPQDAWYYSVVSTAVEKNITKGIGDGKFGVDLNITRQDMAVLLYNIAVDIGAKVDTTPVAFSDDDKIADYAKNAVYALKNLGVVKGMGGNEFAPNNTATRAEAVQMVYNMMNVLGK